MQIKCTQKNEEGSLYANTLNRVRQQRHRIIFCVPPAAASLWSFSQSTGWKSDIFSGLDWPVHNILICHPNLFFPCQGGWQDRRPDVRECTFSLSGVGEVEYEQRVVWGQGSQPDNASSPQRHAPLEVKQQGSRLISLEQMLTPRVWAIKRIYLSLWIQMRFIFIFQLMHNSNDVFHRNITVLWLIVAWRALMDC